MKKSYKELLLLFLLFILGGIGLVFIPADAMLMVRILFNYMDLFMVVLLYVIYATQRVYWITGVSYEEAKEAGEQRRKAYAKKYLKDFGISALGYFVLSLIFQFFHITFYVDIILYLVGVCATAILTTHHKL